MGHHRCIEHVAVPRFTIPTMLKATQFFYNAKSEIMGGGAVSPYIRLYLWAVCGLSCFFAVLGLIFQAWVVAIYTVLAAAFIFMLEATFLVPQVERVLSFLLENFLYRAVIYI